MAAARVLSCLAASSSSIVSAALALPDSAALAASISLLVTPLMAETTATHFPALAVSATICAARAIQAASPTDVPPNFITCRADFMNSRSYSWPAGLEALVQPYHSNGSADLSARRQA